MGRNDKFNIININDMGKLIISESNEYGSEGYLTIKDVVDKLNKQYYENKELNRKIKLISEIILDTMEF